MKTPSKKTPRRLKPHPVPLPGDTYSSVRREAERQRIASGYTSLRVTKRTRELLEFVATEARATHGLRARKTGNFSTYYNLGFDELLYWDALERLGQLPKDMTDPD